MIKKLAILTSGGDSPGMNAAVRILCKYAILKGIKPYFVYGGFKGLIDDQVFEVTNLKEVDEHIGIAGTFIYSARFPQFAELKFQKKGKEILAKKGIDALIVIGGDGSYKGAQRLHELDLKTIALPGTIDNDIASSDYTIGYDTALNTIVDAVSKIRSTMKSHHRAGIVEVMGHGCSDLALYSGLATGAEIIITKENKISIEEISKLVKEQFETRGKDSVIILLSELVYDDLDFLAKEVTRLSGIITRPTVLAYIQRGGVPTARERIDASIMALKAIDLLVENKSGLAIGIMNGEVTATPILDALSIPNKDRSDLLRIINKINKI